MTAYVARGTVIGRDVGEVWVSADGSISASSISDAEPLPGRFVLAGLVDAHAHASLYLDAPAPRALDLDGATEQLRSWAQGGVTYVRDVGSPDSVMLAIDDEPASPAVHAAGRFFALPDRYLPGLYEGVPAHRLVQEAMAEIDRGARWIKIIGDFRLRLEPGYGPEMMYDTETVAAVCAAAHARGARVAVHSTIDNARALVEAGADSIEHGSGMDLAALEAMRARGTAWVPTLCASLPADDADHPAEVREHIQQMRARMSEMLRAAVRLGVPVLTGSDVSGTIPREVSLLAALGLEPTQAVAAATTSGYEVLGVDPWREGTPASLVTYDADPREDVEVLARPTAVIVGGMRLR